MEKIADFQQRLVRAIHNKNLMQEVQETLALPHEVVSPDVRKLANRVENTLAAIALDNDVAQDAIKKRMDESDIVAQVIPDLGAQFQTFRVRISGHNVSQALQASVVEGYVCSNKLEMAARRALRFANGEIRLMKRDDVTTRMVLEWGPALSPVLRKIWTYMSPSFDDFESVRLPAILWPAYFFISPIRKTWRRWRGPSAESAHRFYDPSISLGTPHALIAPLLAVADLKDRDTFVDIGCGDGRVVVAAAQTIGCSTIGVERDGALAAISRTAVEAARVSQLARIVEGDATDINHDQTTIVFLFQPRGTLKPLIDSLRGNLPRGARILVHEQSPLESGLLPDQSVPVFAGNALTVAHIWYV